MLLVDCSLTFYQRCKRICLPTLGFLLMFLPFDCWALNLSRIPLSMIFHSWLQQFHRCLWTRLSLPSPLFLILIFLWSDDMIIYFVFCLQNIKPWCVFNSIYQTNPGNKQFLKKWIHCTYNSVIYMQQTHFFFFLKTVYFRDLFDILKEGHIEVRYLVGKMYDHRITRNYRSRRGGGVAKVLWTV